ncbi:MAG TPA: cytidylate kinase-like family protein [Desulfuromonadaceae bacterium]
MAEKKLIPSIDMRLSSLLEFNRRRELELEAKRTSRIARPTITISREFGCEAYPMAERLRELLEKKSDESWVLMDKALLEQIVHNHKLSEKILSNLGERSRFLDEILATFSSRWTTEKDYFRQLCRQIVSLANQGNVILVGRGSSFITQSLQNCHHFRLFASAEFKVRSIARRLDISREEAEKLITKKQQQRHNFIRDFLDRDDRDLSVYHLVFNNDKNKAEKIAATIMEYVLTK